MNQHSIPLSSAELISKLNEGGWFVSGGHYVRELGFLTRFPVVEASLLGEILNIECDDVSFQVPSDNIVLTNPWVVEIRHTFMLNQQRKKIDGGGWHEVPAVRAVLRLLNPVLEETIRKDREARDKHEKEEQKRREMDAYEAARQQFVAKLTGEFVGKKVTEIDVSDGGLCVGFEDGSELSIELDGGDIYDAWITVNDVSLDNFEKSIYE